MNHTAFVKLSPLHITLKKQDRCTDSLFSRPIWSCAQTNKGKDFSIATTKTHGVASLHNGTWFKLICGASTHDAPMVRNLCEIYATAGVDCIDVAADFPVIQAAREGITRAMKRGAKSPLLMASVSDAEDLHFRKAEFDASLCPSDCPRPCEKVCPAEAIADDGVIEARCYGCGRCIPVCPLGLIEARDYVHDVKDIRRILHLVDALEIHTGKDRTFPFCNLWDSLAEDIRKLKVIAVSLPDLGEDHVLGRELELMWTKMRDVVQSDHVELIWQTDGRPMSGDIGAGTANAAVKLAKKVRRILTELDIPGHVQLAGGTNWKTIPLMKQSGLLRTESTSKFTSAAGLAIGGYGRKVR